MWVSEWVCVYVCVCVCVCVCVVCVCVCVICVCVCVCVCVCIIYIYIHIYIHIRGTLFSHTQVSVCVCIRTLYMRTYIVLWTHKYIVCNMYYEDTVSHISVTHTTEGASWVWWLLIWCKDLSGTWYFSSVSPETRYSQGFRLVMNFQLKKGDDDDKDHDTVICGSHFRSCAAA